MTRIGLRCAVFALTICPPNLANAQTVSTTKPDVQWKELAWSIGQIENGPTANRMNAHYLCRREIERESGKKFNQLSNEDRLRFYTSHWIIKKKLGMNVHNISLIWRWGPEGVNHIDAENYAQRVENLYNEGLRSQK